LRRTAYPLRDLVEEGALVVVPGEWARWRVSWYALFPRRTPPVPKVRLLVDFLGEHFARPADFRPLSRAEI
jgi:DNA-binding transcriptional LysR family regulator